jgi:hypothetical protein
MPTPALQAAATDPYAAIATPIQSATPVASAASDSSDPYASIATPIPPPEASSTPASDTGILAGAKRNTVGLIEGLYHAFTDAPTEQEKAEIKAKIDTANQKFNQSAGAGPRLQFNSDNIPTGALAYHRLVDAPAEMMNKKGESEIEAAKDLLAHAEYWKGANQYLSGLADKGLAKIPAVGPAVGAIAQRGERGDFSGAATDVGAAMLAENAPTLLRNPFKVPQIVKDVTQGAEVAQVPAQEAVRTAAKTGAADVGLSTVPPAGLRTLAEEPINAVNTMKKNVYGQVDKAAGTDLKTLYDRLDKVNDQIDLTAPGSPEEARLEAARTGQMQTIEDAKNVARAKGVNVDKLLDQGDALHTREMALRDFQKGFLKNTGIIEGNAAAGTPETVNVDSGIKALQKLQDNTKFGAPRLEQALGKAGAQQLLKDMYAAQRLGVKAVNLQTLLGKTLRGLEIAGLVGGAGLGVYELAKH